jgi:hypothetical protein
MPQSKGKNENARAESVAGRSASPASPRGPTTPALDPSSCEAALRHVLQLAGAMSLDNRETRGHLPSGRAVRSRVMEASAPEPRGIGRGDQLSAAFRDFEPELALKIRTLMIAGRDGQSIAAVKVNLSLSDADAGFATMAADSSENGPLLVDYLRRGHAIACAMDINLDSPLADWQSSAGSDPSERAWLSFGKQLASSLPGDWQCLGIIEGPKPGISKLYLRLGHDAWWSFQTVLDRPTPAGVDKERRALAKRTVKGISTDSLEALVGQLGTVQGRALRRASRAICARVGNVSAALER